MGVFSIIAACAAMSGLPPEAAPVPPHECQAAKIEYREALHSVEVNEQDRDAIARVALAEAGNQPDAGLAGVVYTVLNRVISEDFPASIGAVIDQPGQFEPVGRVGGWENLPAVSKADRARVDTIINLALSGRLPDPTNGARFFQNPAIVASREDAGEVSAGLTHFGGASPSSVIEDHTFYASIEQGAPAAPAAPVEVQASKPEPEPWDVYGQQEASEGDDAQSWAVYENTHSGVMVGASQ
ncbi:cell wall hydrolase (plasmid) [Guyparkeria sp. 1SP6A2]|nr:cell wall hydrolase [Guyparkeria sp. 1SP6A2]